MSEIVTPIMSTHSSPTPTLVDEPISTLSAVSPLRKYILFAVFCLAQFLDTFNNSALFSAVPSIAGDLNMDISETAWVFSAYQLTFASLLLVSGRISDVYSPKPAFITGSAIVGVMSLAAGFNRNKIGLLVLRALSGVGAAMTIPPALDLIVHLFPDQPAQGRAISIFGGTGAIGNILGLLIGALFVQYTHWSWVFWFMTLLAVPIAIVCFFLIPSQERLGGKSLEKKEKNFDVIGVSTLTAALILLIFALTSGSNNGWASAIVLAPLIISIFLLAGFLFWEAHIPEHHASLPPKLWFIPNFAALFAVALIPYFWWTTVFLHFTALWQEVLHWSVIITAVHFLPIGIIAGVVSLFADSLPKYFHTKTVILTGQILQVIATVLLPFAGSAEAYWPFAFPAFIIGSFGTMLTFSNTNVAIFKATPPEIAGTVGAIFNAALQLGAAVGIAAVTSIQTSVDATKAIELNPEQITGFEGRAASFWFLLAISIVETVSVTVFYRKDKTPANATIAKAVESHLPEVEGEKIKAAAVVVVSHLKEKEQDAKEGEAKATVEAVVEDYRQTASSEDAAGVFRSAV